MFGTGHKKDGTSYKYHKDNEKGESENNPLLTGKP